MTDTASTAAIEACKMLRSSERLLASACFYSEASAIREQRERIERCSVQSVDDMKPDHGEYSPRTIGTATDEAMEEVASCDSHPRGNPPVSERPQGTPPPPPVTR